MHYTTTMSAPFEAEKNKKAFLYTAAICVAILLLVLFITWPLTKVPEPIVQDLIEINLGNDAEGFGEQQPLIKGEMSPTQDLPSPPQEKSSATASDEPAKDLTDDNADKDAAPIAKPVKPVPTATALPKPTATQPVKINTPPVAPTPKPQKPKYAYNGPGNGNGNGATEDNGYRNQGNNPNGTGDKGSPNGKPDSYGNNPGGRTGGPKVTSGDRKIIRYYSFSGDYDKATIYAVIKVSPAGKGTFAGFAKNSTSRNQVYANAISQYLNTMQFDKSDHESTVTVQFNFNVN